MTAKFWVGGTGTWDNSTTAHWSLSTGGAGGAAVPGAADTITFDGASGGGTVTVDTTINTLSFQSITMGAFTGTLDFSINNPSITLSVQFSVTGAGTRTLKLGSGTFTINGVNTNAWDASTVTGLTFLAGTSTILFSSPGNSNAQLFAGGGLSYATFTAAARANGSPIQINSANTFATFNASGQVFLIFSANQTITNAINWAGLSSGLVSVQNGNFNASTSTLTVASGSTISWGAIRGIVFSGATVAATNSFDLGNNTSVTITGPSAGGSGVVIGS